MSIVYYVIATENVDNAVKGLSMKALGTKNE